MMKSETTLILKGNIIFTPTPDEFVVFPNSYLVTCDGIVQEVIETLPEKYENCKVQDYGDRLIIPGFVDLHTHAPQFNQRGLGLDLQLLEWLNNYTFKEESRFYETTYAAKVYENFALELMKQGTTRVAAFATIHKESSQILFDILVNKGIGAYVGKVNMDCNCPDSLQEDTQLSLKETEELIQDWAGNPLVKLIITPRFAITSTKELLAGLGKLAIKYNLPVQSHLSENKAEVEMVAELFPEQKDYHKVYDHYQLFGQTPTLMAHCIHLTDEAIVAMRNNGVVAVHCPDSNLNLSSGIMPVRKLLTAGVQVGLGSDIGAGHDLFMPRIMLKAVQMSKAIYSFDNSQKPLTLVEAFYLGTKGGGMFFGEVGSFEKGYSCDVLVIEDAAGRVEGHSLIERLQRFVYTGDSSNIIARYIAGRAII